MYLRKSSNKCIFQTNFMKNTYKFHFCIFMKKKFSCIKSLLLYIAQILNLNGVTLSFSFLLCNAFFAHSYCSISNNSTRGEVKISVEKHLQFCNPLRSRKNVFRAPENLKIIYSIRYNVIRFFYSLCFFSLTLSYFLFLW